MQTAYIGIGSNIGDAHKNCLDAVDEIRRLPRSRFTGCSNWYETKPVGVEGQNWYINGVVSIETGLSGRDLVRHLLAIEKEMGRVRKERWGPRIIDLDILFLGQQRIHEDALTIPHPRLHLRKFVLIPMIDLAPDFVHPSLQMTMTQLLDRLAEDGQVVVPLKE